MKKDCHILIDSPSLTLCLNEIMNVSYILIAGETGSGKSTQLRSNLTSLILTKKPSELEFN
ncbi:FtsK/SpoIIIE domain-containing protein [Metabacillus sediminilitoris]|uniref:Uncharacterized protein n=1 Tax=Metabacillus sediminilitoris TaxID=2567941 RepID=A0A4S4BVQ9_9BACI|nr:hypothetical protein GMB29_13775 [Metabacillus sediminilitoris]THF79244.1 hypothetical protein E6W99_12885 [Metabacillus sediminilitoris]